MAPLTDPGSSPRRWTVIASGLLCGMLALVVIFTDRAAFRSPLAVVVVAAIGLTAVLLQLRLQNRRNSQPVHPPLWLNLLGIALASAALFADFLKLTPQAAHILVLGAVGSFGVSSAIMLQAFRRGRAVK